MSQADAQCEQLRPVEVLTLTHLANGLDTVAAAFKLGIKPETLMIRLREVRRKVGDGSRAYVLHRCYMERLLALPVPDETSVLFTPEEQRVWTVVATYPTPVGVPNGATRAAIRALMDKAEAKSEPHLVKLGHQWGLLNGPKPR
ncbi:hypothetical protein [Streptomyces chrestomyceticus]|uniref:hypothetical protein n=1 Tax=Streptomyces chrestomyceticus TaxID=68185 RepID=UPI0019D0C1B0|nr:hypothetical protein [Streptomyces chrestomyceticus]